MDPHHLCGTTSTARSRWNLSGKPANWTINIDRSVIPFQAILYLARRVHFQRSGPIETVMPFPHTRPNAAEQRMIPLRSKKKERWSRSWRSFLFEYSNISYTLCIGSGLSSKSSSKFPEMALFNSGPASCKVLRPALERKISNSIFDSISNSWKIRLNYLKRDGIVTLFVAVLHFLLFPLLEPSEVVLDQKCGVKFTNGHLVVAWKPSSFH